jgi:hypothetical protein
MPKGKRRQFSPVAKQRLEELLSFDRETGEFRWREDRRGGRGIPKGRRAGSVDPNGYRYIRVDGHDYLAQRLAWFWEYGEWPPGVIRFRDGSRDNCAISNLRDASYIEEGKFDWRTRSGRSAQQKAYRATIQDELRDKRLRATFGISLERYMEMHAAQDGRCDICGLPEAAERNGRPRMLAVDHCHDTKRVRGLLCGKCNPMIGYADHTIDTLTRAIDYLRRTNGATS